MQKAVVAPETCRPVICPSCLARQICPTKAIVRFELDDAAIVDAGRCRGCGKCVAVCPWQAIVVADQ